MSKKRIDRLGTKNEKRSRKTGIAGGLLVFAAVLGILFSTLMIGSGFFLEDMDEWMTWSNDEINLEGKVVDEKGTPLEGVQVSLKNTSFRTKTDSSGNYRIEDVPVGYHQMMVEREGYRPIIFKTYLPHVLIGFHRDEESHVYGAGDVEIHDEKEVDFSMSQGDDTLILGRDRNTTEKLLTGAHGMLTIFGLICSIIALTGGISALGRNNYELAIVGGVAGIFSFGFGIGSIMAFIALLLVILASDNFK